MHIEHDIFNEHLHNCRNDKFLKHKVWVPNYRSLDHIHLLSGCCSISHFPRLTKDKWNTLRKVPCMTGFLYRSAQVFVSIWFHLISTALHQKPVTEATVAASQSSQTCCTNSPLRGSSATYKSEGAAGKLAVTLTKISVTCWKNSSALRTCSPSHSGRTGVWHELEKGRSEERNWIICTLA